MSNSCHQCKLISSRIITDMNVEISQVLFNIVVPQGDYSYQLILTSPAAVVKWSNVQVITLAVVTKTTYAVKQVSHYYPLAFRTLVRAISLLQNELRFLGSVVHNMAVSTCQQCITLYT